MRGNNGLSHLKSANNARSATEILDGDAWLRLTQESATGWSNPPKNHNRKSKDRKIVAKLTCPAKRTLCTGDISLYLPLRLLNILVQAIEKFVSLFFVYPGDDA